MLILVCGRNIRFVNLRLKVFTGRFPRWEKRDIWTQCR